jgi:ABC-type phosphate/phosphonate transport system substrate-binding protein
MNRTTLVTAALLAALSTPAAAAPLRVAIIQAQAGDARKYQPLLDYLAQKGVAASFVTAPDHRAAAEMFAADRVDAMFGGSGVAGVMMLKGLAAPLVRGLSASGTSTYHGVIVAPKGSFRFDGTGASFAGKRVIYSGLASAGEIYFQSLGPAKSAVRLRAASHGAALDALSRGQADVAVIKNHVWSAEKSKYPALEQVGEDSGENPDGSLIVSARLAAEAARQVEAALLGLGADASAGAVAAKGALKITGYVSCSEKDFAHTLDLLRKAGVTKTFAFQF